MSSSLLSSPDRSRGTQRWMKLRTTVQISGAVASAVKEKKPPLKREDSFLKRFSTRQIAESDTVDNDGEEAGGGSDASAARRRRRRRKDEHITVVNPDENFYFAWLSLLTLCVLYNCWTLIVRQAFPELQGIAQPLWISLDGFSDVVFLCDIVVQIRTGYLEQGLMVYDSRKLAMHYIRSRAFLLDLASLLPLDVVQLPVNMAIPIVRFPRFLKLYRSYNYYYMVESRTLYPNLWRVVNLIHILLLLAHWFGCFYFLLSEAEGFHGEWTYPNYRQPEREAFATLTRKYLGSLYWSTLTLTTIGDLPTPESDWEYLFTIVSYLIGVFIFATIVGQVGNVITNRNASRLEFERLLDGAKLYMRQHKVPRDMQRRVQRWYDYSWSRGRMQGGGDINSALGILPDKLKTELALHVNLYTLKKVSIFQECQPEFLHDLVLKMKAYIFTPGDLICRKGEVAREMFIIADGILEVISWEMKGMISAMGRARTVTQRSEAGKVLTTMRAGDFFGEIGILNLDGLNKRTADVRSVGYAELFSLSREDVLAAMKDYPEAQEILQSLGRKRLMEAKLAAAGVRKESDSDSRKGSSSGGKDSSTGDGDSAKSRAVQMVRRLKRDARGLRNYLRRGGRHGEQSEQRKADTVRIEMEPMSPTGDQPASTDVDSSQQGAAGDPHHDGLTFRRFFWGKKEPTVDEGRRESKFGKSFGTRTRGILMRMQRVNSTTEPPVSPPTPVKRVTVLEPKDDDVESSVEPLGSGLPLLQRLLLLKEREERQALEAKTMSSPPPYEEPLGAGLPILKRLKLMREKEEKERKELEEKSAAAAKQGPLRSADKEPPERSPVAIAGGSGLPATFFPSEPIGAGLPLLQRLKLLREREEQERAEAERREAAAAARSNGAKTSLAKALLLKKLETLKEEDKSQNAESMERGRSFLEEDPSPAGRGQVRSISPVHDTVPNLLTCDRPGRESKMSVTALLHTTGPPSPTLSRSTGHTPTSRSPGQTPPAQMSPSPSRLAPPTSTMSASEALPPTPKRSGWLAIKASVMKSESVTSKPATASPLRSPYSRVSQNGTRATKNGTGEISKLREAEPKDVEDGQTTKEGADTKAHLEAQSADLLPSLERAEDAPSSAGDDYSTRTPPPSPVVQVPSPPAQQQQQLQQRPMDFKPEEYLADLLVGVKQVLQSRLEDIQDQFKSRLVSLEEEVRRKDLIIKRLEETLQRCEVHVESGGATSPRIARSPDEVLVQPEERQDVEDDKKTSSSTASEESLTGCTSEVDDFFDDDDFEEPSDVTHPGYVSHPRRSWPLLPPWSERHRPGAAQRAWESQAALVIDPEQLWRVEFPGVSGGPSGRHWQGSPLDEEDRTTVADGDSTSGSGSQLDTDEADGVAAVEAEAAARHDSANDWEIKMLAEQLLQREEEKEEESDDSDTSHDAQPLPSPSGGKQATASRVTLQRRASVRDKKTFEEEVGQPPPRARAMSLDVQMGTSFPGGSTPPVIEEPTTEENEDDETVKVVVQEAEVLEARGEESLLGVLQQLSPTERRELERLLEVATRKHLSRQQSLHQPEVGNQGLDTPRRQHSLTEGMITLSPHGPASPVSSGIRRRSSNHQSTPPTSAATPSAYAVPQAAEGESVSNNSQCFYEDEVGCVTRRPPLPPPLTLVSPPAEDDSVSICIPEYEPLLGPK